MITKRLAQSPEYLARVARYSLIGSSLRSRPVDGMATGLVALQLGPRVRAALDESADSERQPAPVRRNRALPYALVAGLALVAVAVVQGPLLLRPAADPVHPVQASAQRLVVAPAPVGQASLSSRRLTNYLVYHGEYSGLLSTRVTESHIVNGRTDAVALRSPTQ